MIKKIILGIIGLVVVIGIFGALSGGDKGEKVGENNSTPSNESPSNSNQTTVYKVGDKIQLGKVILSVNSLETSQGSQFTKPSEGNEWLNLNLTIENTGTTQEYITTLGQMFVLDGAGNQFQVSVTNKSLENPGVGGLDGAIVAGAKKTGWVGFEVPKTAQGLKLQYNASFFNNNNVVVDLGR